MTWGEAVRLARILSSDPASMICAAASGWDAPRSREWLLLADLFDAYGVVHFKKPKPYPRPFMGEGSRRFGKTKLSRAEVVAILNAHGHDLN